MSGPIYLQKIVYCKRLLRGSAKLFVQYEKCCKSWTQLAEALKTEFSAVIDTHKVHKELMKRQKNATESYQEYIYKMCEIAAQASIEKVAVIKYIIEGIQDDVVKKTILYGATSIQDLKKKFTLYESMKETVQKKGSKRTEGIEKKKVTHVPSADGKRCYNCRSRNHMSSECPLKSKGTKCFACNEYGHISTKCTAKKNVANVNGGSPKVAGKKSFKDITIKNAKSVALVRQN